MRRSGLFALMFLCTQVLAQPGVFSIKGKVIDALSQQAVEYVSVAIYQLPDSALIAGTITNSLGLFEVNRLKPGRYFLRADFIGFETVTIDGIQLNAQTPSYHAGDIHISQKSLAISAVEVVSDGPAVSYKVDRKVITVSRDLAAQGSTAVEVLQNVPSVQTDLEGNVSLRGSSNFKVLIDGRQSPLAGSDALNQMPASSIDKIEIITNPSVKYDPDGTAGIINIITKKGKYNGVSLLADAAIGTSPLSNANVHLTIKKNRWSNTIGLNYQKQSFDMVRTLNRETYTTGDSTVYLDSKRNGVFSRDNLGAKTELSYMLSDKNTLFVGGSLNYFAMKRDGVSRIHEYGLHLSEYYFSNNYLTVNPIGYQIVIGDRHEFNRSDHFLSIETTLDNTINHNTESREQYISNNVWELTGIDTLLEARTLENENQFRVEMEYQNVLSDRLSIEAGLMSRYRYAGSNYMVYQRGQPDAGWMELPAYDVNFDFERYISGGYLLVKTSNTKQNLSGNIGLRVEHTDRSMRVFGAADTTYTYEKVDFYPSFSTVYTFANKNVVQLSYSRRIERPRDYILVPVVFMSDGFSSYVGNPNLLPEHTDAIELNYQFVWGKSFLAIESFYRYTKNALDRVQTPAGDGSFSSTYINLDTEQNIGGELGGSFNLFKWWSMSPSVSFYYTLVHGMYNNQLRRREGYSGRGVLNTSFDITSSTKFQLNGYLSLPQVTIDGKSFGSMYTSAAIKQDLLNRKLSITASVDDIFNTRNRHMISEDETFRQELKMQRNGPFFILAVSYRFNQSKVYNKQGNANGEGMDIMF